MVYIRRNLNGNKRSDKVINDLKLTLGADTFYQVARVHHASIHASSGHYTAIVSNQNSKSVLLNDLFVSDITP